MESLTRQISPAHKKKLLIFHSMEAAFVVLCCWLLYVLKAVFGIDVLSLLRPNHPDPPSTRLLLIFAIVSTVGGAGYVRWKFKCALQLARRGIEVVGKISFVSPIPIKGHVQIHCKYVYGNREYTHRYSQDMSAKTPAVGDPLTLLVDRYNPSKCMRASELLLGPTKGGAS